MFKKLVKIGLGVALVAGSLFAGNTQEEINKILHNKQTRNNLTSLYKNLINNAGIGGIILYKNNFKGPGPDGLTAEDSYTFIIQAPKKETKLGSLISAPGKKIMSVVYVNPNFYENAVGKEKAKNLTSEDIKILQTVKAIDMMTSICTGKNKVLYNYIEDNPSNTILWHYIYTKGTNKEKEEKSFVVTIDKNTCEIYKLISGSK